MFSINILNKKRNDQPTMLNANDLVLFENLKKDKLKISNETINLARKGDPRAQFLVGNEYYHNNTKADYLKALEWYHRSASSGYDNAQCSLGYMYYCGNEGIPTDKQQAVQWYAAAASQGNAGAQQMLQNLNAQGYFPLINYQSDYNTDINPYYNTSPVYSPVEYEQDIQQQKQKPITPPSLPTYINEEETNKYHEKLPSLPSRANSTFDMYRQQDQKPNERTSSNKEEKEEEHIDNDPREYAIENEKLRIEIRGLLKQHEDDVREKEALTQRISYLEDQVKELEKVDVVSLERQIEKLVIERDEAREAGARMQEANDRKGKHGNIYEHYSNDSGEDLNNDLNYDTPEE